MIASWWGFQPPRVKRGLPATVGQPKLNALDALPPASEKNGGSTQICISIAKLREVDTTSAVHFVVWQARHVYGTKAVERLQAC